MGRPRKATLTVAEKKYIDLSLKTYNGRNFDELFTRLAAELDRGEDTIRDYANQVSPVQPDEQLPPEPAPKVLHPQQVIARDLMTPNRHSESNKARHVTVMSEAASEVLKNIPSAPIKGSSRTKDAIFRQ